MLALAQVIELNAHDHRNEAQQRQSLELAARRTAPRAHIRGQWLFVLLDESPGSIKVGGLAELLKQSGRE